MYLILDMGIEDLNLVILLLEIFFMVIIFFGVWVKLYVILLLKDIRYKKYFESRLVISDF